MRLVTLNTIRDGAVGISMTEVTGKGCMLARADSHLLVRTGVTGDTDLLVLALQADIQRLVRIVATEAVVNFVVRTALVAITAARDIFCNARPMAFMAGLAINFGFVGRAVCSDLRGLFSMAFGTIIN